MLTGNSAATATFTFTGVAIYFMSPLWPYVVNTAVSLDSSPPILIDLIDHSKPNVGVGPETVQSKVVWGDAGLPNSQHTFVVSVGAGQPYAVVDALIYTVLDPGDLTSSSTLTTTSKSSTTTTTNTTTARSTQGTTFAASPSAHVLPIALGTVLGLLGLLIIALAMWCCRRQKKRPVSEAWTVAGHSYFASPQMTSIIASPRSTARLAVDDSVYANNPAYYPATDGWGFDPQYGNINVPTAPPPVAMPPAHTSQSRSSTMPNPNDTEGYNSLPETQLNVPPQVQPQFARRNPAIVYDSELSRLSTITEKSTPPLGGSPSLANFPAEQQTDTGSIYYDAEENGSENRTSPSVIIDGRSGPSGYPIHQPHIWRDVATRSQQGLRSTRSFADSPISRKRPPTYT